MPISWNEIRQNAIRFSREWAETKREDAEAKSFWRGIMLAEHKSRGKSLDKAEA